MTARTDQHQVLLRILIDPADEAVCGVPVARLHACLQPRR